MTTQADRTEAARLVDLDERGRTVEAVALVLAMRRQAAEAADELAAIDREMLDGFSRTWRGHTDDGGGSAFAGP